jgi:hypothetical protein
VLAGEPLTLGAEHVGQRVRDVVGDLFEAQRVEAVGAETVGVAVGAGRVDHRAGRHLRDGTVGFGDPQRERCCGASGGASAVHALARHRGHRHAGAYSGRDRGERCERLEVLLNEFCTGWRLLLLAGLVPAVRLEQPASGRIDEVLPRREEADVAPGPHAARDRVTRFVDDEVEAALDEVRRGREADGPRTDDGDRKVGDAGVAHRWRREVDQGHDEGLRGSMNIDEHR